VSEQPEYVEPEGGQDHEADYRPEQDKHPDDEDN